MNKFEQQLVDAKKRFRTRLLIVGLGGFSLLFVALFVIYWTRAVSVHITPQEAAYLSDLSISDGVGLVIAGKVFSLGKQAELLVKAKGFYDETIEIDFGSGIRNISVNMREVPSQVVITTTPASEKTQWLLNGKTKFVGERFVRNMLSGLKSVEIDHPYFVEEVVEFEVERAKSVLLEVELKPISRNLVIQSVPDKAQVEINGELVGQTPVEVELEGGVHNLNVSRSGYFTATDTIEVTNTSNDLLRDFILKTKLAFVGVTVSPTGGMLTVDGLITNPSSKISLTPNQNHVLRYEKEGYISQSSNINLKPEEQTKISFQLQEETGQVIVKSHPVAEILVDGKSFGNTPQDLKLQTIPQTIVLRQEGYRAEEISITPDANSPLLVQKILQTEFEVQMSQAANMVTNSAGIKMKLFDPRVNSRGRYTMGAPRNETGQRANEFLREVELTKPFYVGTTEVTEGQFASFKGSKPGNPDFPVKNVSWTHVVEFCNWLSKQEGLELVYNFANGIVIGFNPKANGYRLLTEAEWEWLARVAGRSKKFKFVWGNKTTIPPRSGNFADESGKKTLARIIPRYNDGFPSIAPVGSFPADPAGLHDVAGNVSEWVHDVYSLIPPKPNQVELNPFGEQIGTSHVIKGSNFRSATVTEMRSSFREGLTEEQEEIGFRIARYVYGKEG